MSVHMSMHNSTHMAIHMSIHIPVHMADACTNVYALGCACAYKYRVADEMVSRANACVICSKGGGDLWLDELSVECRFGDLLPLAECCDCELSETTHMYADMCADMCTNMCVYRCVPRLWYRFVHRHVSRMLV